MEDVGGGAEIAGRRSCDWDHVNTCLYCDCISNSTLASQNMHKNYDQIGFDHQ